MIGAIKKYKRRTKEFTSSYGEFAFNFEAVCLKMKSIIEAIFLANGLKEETKFVKILLHDSTAFPLLNYLKASIFEHYKVDLENNKPLQRKISIIFNKLLECIELRNNLIHSYWGIGYSIKGESVDDICYGFKDKVKSLGIESQLYTYRTSDFSEAAHNVSILWDYLSELENVLKTKGNILEIEKIDFSDLSSISFKVKSDS